MQKFILAVSPDTKLLIQIQAHLQEGGRYSVVCVSSGREALSSLEAENYDIAILDGEISDMPFVTLTREMVTLSPELKLLVFPPQNNPHHPVLTGLLANGFLNKPFFGPEVSEKINKALNQRNSSTLQTSAQEVDVASAWIKYPEVGAQQIEQLLASTSAAAGLLLLHGQVLATSGVLTQESSGNIINYLNRYWTNIQSGELFRYLTMEHEASSYIIYAAPLIKDTAIGLVYHAQKPLPEIRVEVSRLRKAFLERYSNTRELRQEFAAQEEKTAPIVDEPPPPPVKPMNTHVFKNLPQLDEEEGEEYGEALSEKELESLNNILSEMPVPDPNEVSITAPTTETSQAWIPAADIYPGETLEPSASTPSPASAFSMEGNTELAPDSSLDETTPAPATPEPATVSNQEQFPNFDFKLPWEDGTSLVSEPVQNEVTAPYPSYIPPIPISEEPAGSYTEQQSASVPPFGQKVLVPFTFLLFPADPGQFITRDLGMLCNRQLPLILNSFGWELNAISVRPLYLQWSAKVPPVCHVPEKLADIKLQLNTLFFNSQPELLRNNPDGEFWLSSYIGLSGSQPPSNRMINDFIALYRQTESQVRSY